MTNPFVLCESVSKQYPAGRLSLQAVRDISLDLRRGEVVGLVGESGSGKSTLGRLIAGLEEPSSGRILIEGEDLTTFKGRRRKALHRKVQLIFQDPYASLNPRMSVYDIITEGIEIHNLAKGEEKRERAAELLRLVGLSPDFMVRYPHEFSGGQRQRICIARALSVEPELIVCDEVLASLDLSIQAQVVNLLKELQEKMRLTYLFITHDLAMLRHIADRVAVMILGQIVEIGRANELYHAPSHPYTEALLSLIPQPKEGIRRSRIVLKGEAPSPIHPPKGCAFSARCKRAQPICFERAPILTALDPGASVACHFAGEPSSFQSE